MSDDHASGLSFGTLAAAVLDDQGRVRWCSRAAADLVGRSTGAVRGRPVRELLAEMPARPGGAAADQAGPSREIRPATGRARLRHSSGDTVDVTFQAMPMPDGLLVLAAPTRDVTEREQGVSVLHALFSQDRVGIAVQDADLTIARTNVTPTMFGGPAVPPGTRLLEVMDTEDARALEIALRQVLATGAPLVGWQRWMHSPLLGGREFAFSLSAFRMEDALGRPAGVLSAFSDTTEQQLARRHLDLLHEATARIGGSLDVRRTAQELAERDDLDIDDGQRRLMNTLAECGRPGQPLHDTDRAIRTDLGGRPPRDDIALLLARTRALPAESTASWELPADPAAVADAREKAARQLAVWGLDELSFITELVVSELVTNAIRYAGAPIVLRLIRGDVLVCEVSDPSNTHPRLRRAHSNDEGGRGLFLIAQLTSRWGSRYGRRGKTIWAEQPLAAPAAPAA
ncbi:PAS domain-containing protein [Kitasatospora sp. NPDC004669]|uniref:PAS domain-containing protein n=1 Tax=Kitasatospora sp. NPDC004669 TaxID=3154555 RepID=UPI0033B598BD